MNRVTAKKSLNWFELTGVRAHRLRGPSVSFAPHDVIWIQQTPPSARCHRQRLPVTGTHRVGDGWETLTYSVLWLCGLLAIGLCWV